MQSQEILQWTLIVASLVLQVMVIQALIRGPYKEYPFAFTYSLVLFFTTVMDIARYTEWSKVLPQEFYLTETMRQIFLFAVVVSFIDRAMEEFVYRQRVRGALVFLALLVAWASIYFHSEGRPAEVPVSQIAKIATRVARDLSFTAVILTLLLWSMLLGRKSVDRQLLLATGGLGLQFTADAIGQSLRQLAQPGHVKWLVMTGNLLIVGSHLMRLYVWWEAFRTTPAEIEVTSAEPHRKYANAEGAGGRRSPRFRSSPRSKEDRKLSARTDLRPEVPLHRSGHEHFHLHSTVLGPRVARAGFVHRILFSKS